MRAEQLLNRTIAGYRLIKILGKGGMGMVFLAQHVEDPQNQVAIKILFPSDFTTTGEFAAFQTRFLREIQVVRQLQHEHILPILASGEAEDGIFYMVMPLISGGTLDQKIKTSSKPLPLDDVARYISQLAIAIDYSHQQGMVHRDIKSSNVLLDEQGNVYLADFGIVRLFDSSHLALEEVPTSLTVTGQIYGTPSYMAPERFQGEPAEPATDIYALGVLLYQLVTGQLPFEADNPLALAMKHLNDDPAPPRSLRPDLPEPAEVAILKALAKRPVRRFSTATALAAAFSTGLTGEWVEELLPLKAMLAVSSLETQGRQPAAAAVAPLIMGNARSDLLLQSAPPQLARNDALFADASTVTNAPVTTRSSAPSLWRRLHLLAIGVLAVILLVSAGLLAMVISRSGGDSGLPIPGVHPQSTSTSGLPTQTGPTVTPASTTGTQPTPGSTTGSTPIPGETPQPTPTPGVTPVPTPTPEETPAPTPTTEIEGTPST